jgi:hypothetical protein
MTSGVLMPSGEHIPNAEPALVAIAPSLEQASAAIAAGADIVDLLAASERDVTAFAAAHPGVPFCADDDRAMLVRQRAAGTGLARIAGGAGRSAARPLVCCEDAASAKATGLPPERLVVVTTPAGLLAALRTGYSVLVDIDVDAAEAGPESSAAAAALSAWLGAAMVRTCHPGAVRQALDMTASIRGTRPPARAVRGLA